MAPTAPWLTAARIVAAGSAANAVPPLPPPKIPLSPPGCGELDSDSDEPMSEADSDSDYASESGVDGEMEEEELDDGRHSVRAHGDAAGAKQESTSQPKSEFRCNVATCGSSFVRSDQLLRHRARYHEAASARTFACKPCKMSFSTRREKELHSREVAHQRFPCTVTSCTKSYSKREHLTRHVLSIHKAGGHEKPFRCELCHIGFAYSHGLSRHMNRSHLNENKPYKCAQCLLAFKKKSDLQAHSFVHTGVLPFDCGECGERFAKRFQLGRHERRHAANKEAQSQVIFCEETDCGQMLFSAAEKAKHDCEVHNKPPVEAVKQESGVAATCKKRKRGRDGTLTKSDDGVEASRRQLLKCEVCGRMLQRKQNLRAHLRTHFQAVDERKLHVCPMEDCESAFTRKSNLMAHYNAVHDAVRSQRFVCPYDGCKGKFGYKKVLLTHIESIHENPTPTKRAKARSRTAMATKTRVLGSVVGEESGESVDVIFDS